MADGGHGFLRQFLRDPRRLGAVAPATTALARTVGRATHALYLRHSQPRILELGAGTGALTQQIQPFHPVLVERDGPWADALRGRFPELEVRHECAIATLAALDHPVGVVSSIPLWNNPQARPLRQLLLARYREGLVKFCVLYTYGWTDPLGGIGFRECRRAGFVPRSLPPAHVWAYQ